MQWLSNKIYFIYFSSFDEVQRIGMLKMKMNRIVKMVSMIMRLTVPLNKIQERNILILMNSEI